MQQRDFDRFLADCIESQAGISTNAKIELSFELLLEKPALLSGEVGYAYPVSVVGTAVDDEFIYELGLTVPTPALPLFSVTARQLFANAVDEQFEGDVIDKASLLEWMQSDSGSVATPHAQRSYAYVKLISEASTWPSFDSLVRNIESVIGTPCRPRKACGRAGVRETQCTKLNVLRRRSKAYQAVIRSDAQCRRLLAES